MSEQTEYPEHSEYQAKPIFDPTKRQSKMVLVGINPYDFLLGGEKLVAKGYLATSNDDRIHDGFYEGVRIRTSPIVQVHIIDGVQYIETENSIYEVVNGKFDK